MIQLRCSRLPALFTCPSSHMACEHPVRADSEPAAIGRTVHKLLASMILTGELPEIEDSEVSMLCAFGRQAWRDLKEQFPDPHVEAENAYLGGGPEIEWVLSGHVDVFSLGVVLDFKSGRKRSDYTPQVKGYGLQWGAMRGAIVWLRDREVEILDVSDHAAIEREITEKVSQIGKIHNAGKHCGFCPRINECAAYREFAEAALAPFLPTPLHEDFPVDRSRVAKVYEQAKAVAQILKRFDVLLRSDIDKNGPLDLGDGREVAFVDSTKKIIDPAPALPHLLDEFPQEDVAKCLTIGKGKLKSLVESKAAKGYKGKDWMALMERLVEADAVVERTTRELRTRKRVE